MQTARPQHPHCSSDCDQGRRSCSTPQACLLPEDDHDNLRPARGFVAALLITAALAALVIVLTWSDR
jgi:hypothetical protein